MNGADQDALDPAVWFRYADEDLRVARLFLRRDDGRPRHVCWHAQQSAEKALKALLLLEQVSLLKTHDLRELARLAPDAASLQNLTVSLDALTEWQITARYPGDWREPLRTDAVQAESQARAVCDAVKEECRRRGMVFRQSNG